MQATGKSKEDCFPSFNTSEDFEDWRVFKNTREFNNSVLEGIGLSEELKEATRKAVANNWEGDESVDLDKMNILNFVDTFHVHNDGVGGCKESLDLGVVERFIQQEAERLMSEGLDEKSLKKKLDF